MVAPDLSSLKVGGAGDLTKRCSMHRDLCDITRKLSDLHPPTLCFRYGCISVAVILTASPKFRLERRVLCGKFRYSGENSHSIVIYVSSGERQLMAKEDPGFTDELRGIVEHG